MMHEAWSSIEEMLYCFSRSYVKLQGYTALKIVEFDPNWAFPDCYSSFDSPMATKWCTKLEVALKRRPIVFQGYTSNCKVTQLKKSSITTQIGRFWTVTPVWIPWWIWNDTHSLMLYRRHALSFLAATKQLYKWYFPSVRPSVCHTFLYARLKNGRIMPWQCLSVCPSVRPSVRQRFPDFSSTCFEISIWNLVYTFSRWHDMSSFSWITIGSLWPSLLPKVGQTHILQSWPHKSR